MGVVLRADPVLLRKPFEPHLAMGALSSSVPSWRLQVHLGCIRLSPALFGVKYFCRSTSIILAGSERPLVEGVNGH